MLTVMHAENHLEKPSSEDRFGHHAWYFAALGLIGGAAIVASAVLPQQIAGLTLIAAAFLIGIVDRLARRYGAAPPPAKLRLGTISYYVAVALILIGSFVIVWTVVRNSDTIWVAWIVAAVQFIVALSGAWVVGRRVAHKTEAVSA